MEIKNKKISNHNIKNNVHYNPLKTSANLSQKSMELKKIKSCLFISSSETKEIEEWINKNCFFLDGTGKKHLLSNKNDKEIYSAIKKYGYDIFCKFKKEKIKIIKINPENMPPAKLIGGIKEWPKDNDGCYMRRQKMILVADSLFYDDCLAHELGHALDDILEKDSWNKINIRSEADEMLITKLLAQYRTRIKKDPTLTWSDYAQTNECEYLTEGIYYFLYDDEMNEKLKKCDPLLYRYVNRILNEAAR